MLKGEIEKKINFKTNLKKTKVTSCQTSKLVTLVMSTILTSQKANPKNNKVKFQVIKIIRDEIKKNTIKKRSKTKEITIKIMLTKFDIKII